MFNWQDCYASFINLDHRKDRLQHMTTELARVGLTATRTRGRLPEEFDLTDPKYGVMLPRSKGAIGCYESQMDVMGAAYFHGKSAIVMEDDLIFCDDLKDRLDYIQNWLNTNEPDWDVFFLGGTYHQRPEWHRSNNGEHSHPDLKMCNCTVNKDWDYTNDRRIRRTYGAFSTHAYIVNYKNIPKILKLLQDKMYLSMGIDWTFILLQPHLKCYAFVPGCVIQKDNRSDIGNGDTIFSNFRHLGKHWYGRLMRHYNP